MLRVLMIALLIHFIFMFASIVFLACLPGNVWHFTWIWSPKNDIQRKWQVFEVPLYI